MSQTFGVYKKTISFLIVAVFLILIYIGGFSFGLISMSCRNSLGIPISAKTKPSTNKVGQMEILTTEFCYLGIDSTKDPLFKDAAIRIKIGFFNKFGFLQIYPARLGAMTPDDIKIPVGICESQADSSVCKAVDPLTVFSKLKKNTIMRGSIVIKDSSPWQVSAMVTKYSSFLIKFSQSLLNQLSPPPTPKTNDFVLQITQFYFE